MPRGHILCLTSNFPRWPGDATTPFVQHLVQDLHELGWELTVLAPHAPATRTTDMVNGIPVRRFRYLLPESLETVCYQGGALINLRKHRANYLKLPALIASEWLHTVRLLRQGHFHLLHSHWLLPQGFIGALSAGPLGLPHLCTVHGGDVFGLQAPLYQRLKAATIRRCQAVTANSSVTRQRVLDLCPGYAALHTIPMGVAPSPPPPMREVAALRQRLGQDDGPLLLFVGRLIEEKGVGDLLAAFAQVLATHPRATLAIVGEGQDRPEFVRQAERLGPRARVVFTGWIAEEQLPLFLHSADIFVAPSRTARDGWMEAQGLTIIEAMMAGRPVVACASGGIVDSIVDGESGLLVPEASPEKLAAAITRLLADPELGQRLGAQAQLRARAKFSRQASAAAFSALYADLLARHARRS